MIKLSKGANLIAPASLHWEIGNAFSAMLKRKSVSIEQVFPALAAYRQIPIQFSEMDIETALELFSKFNIYAYDAYVISCALKHKSPLVTLDEKLLDVAQSAGAAIIEVRP